MYRVSEIFLVYAKAEYYWIENIEDFIVRENSNF